MISNEVDPYEARLFQMFKSCDKENRGLLDEKALRQLCNLLELQDKGEVVISDILTNASANTNEVHITYELFKEALLNFLGGGDLDSTSPSMATTQINSSEQISHTIEGKNQQKRSLVINDDAEKSALESPLDSSDREVSPKLIVGSKKYGRRSRPQQHFVDDNSLTETEDDDTLGGVQKSGSKAVERSSSQTDIPSNRRRRTLDQSGSKLKRCASLPAQRNLQVQAKSPGYGNKAKTSTNHKGRTTKSATQKASLLSADDTARKQLSSSVESLGHDTLSATIRDVWSSYSAEIGSRYLTCAQLRVVCERLGLQQSLAERVAVESFEQLHSCQYNQLIAVQDFIKLLTGVTSDYIKQSEDASLEVYDSNKTPLKGETPGHMETLPVQSIIEIWDNAGVVNGKNILLALGFDEREVQLSNLYKVIDEEVRSLEEEQQMTLIRASLALQTAELTSVRQVLRQVHDENVKLRADNKEANRRVTMLAMEIDERHALLEENAKEEVHTLEQRHSNVIRDLTARMASDRENWNNLTAKLEARIKTFELEEIRLKTDLELIRKENEEMESEQHTLQKQITELLEQNIQLNRAIADFSENSHCNEALERISKIGENVSDHITTEDEVMQLVEKLSSLQLENHKLRDKNDELITEVENLNIELQRYKVESKKRSSAPPTNSTSLGESESSLEEVDTCTVSLATKRRGDSPSKTHITEESPRTGKLRKCGNDDDMNSDCSHQSDEWIALNTELKQHASETQITMDGSPDVVKILRRRVSELEALLKGQQQQQDVDITENAAGVSTSGEKCGHANIVERCKELETSLEQMQAAYEDCEDYWQSKLHEERQLFDKQRHIYEDDQQESDKKFTELMEKVREYEEQFNKDGRLSPIEEKDLLEQQYADLEAELKAERDNSKRVIKGKSKEIDTLQTDIEALHNEIENLHARLGEIVTDACDFSSKAAINQRDSHGSSASSPISYLWHQSTIQQPANLVDANATPSSPSKQFSCAKLSTTELSTFSTPVNQSTSSSTPQACISPIQKPPQKTVQPEIDDNGAAGDCDTTSTTSGKSLETQSIVSTQSERRGLVSGDEKPCATPTSIREELKRLKYVEISLKEQIKDLSFQRDGLVMELQQLQEARPVLEKAYARTAHPNLTQRISQLELRNRHLQNVIKQQQQYSDSMMQQSWRQYQTEMNDLHGRLDAQVAMITEQGQRLQNADMLVKDLYVENAHLTATVQRLEQQRLRVTMMHQQQQQHMHQLQGLNMLPGMP